MRFKKGKTYTLAVDYEMESSPLKLFKGTVIKCTAIDDYGMVTLRVKGENGYGGYLVMPYDTLDFILEPDQIEQHKIGSFYE